MKRFQKKKSTYLFWLKCHYCVITTEWIKIPGIIRCKTFNRKNAHIIFKWSWDCQVLKILIQKDRYSANTACAKYVQIKDLIEQNSITNASFDVVTLIYIAIALRLATGSKPGIYIHFLSQFNPVYLVWQALNNQYVRDEMKKSIWKQLDLKYFILNGNNLTTTRT